MHNRRPFSIKEAHDRMPLAQALADRFPQIPLADWERRCDAGMVVDHAGNVCGKSRIVRSGERLFQIFPDETEPPVAADIRVLHLDGALLLVHKPAPLPMHPCGRFHRNTLQHLLNLACHPLSPKPVHRLDANTTGLVLFALDRSACRAMQARFLSGDVEKSYLVRVAGHPGSDVFSSRESVSSIPLAAGVRLTGVPDGREARTDFRVIRRDADGTALLEARLLTGRTNQIRAHLWAMGHPVVGDPAYRPDGKTGVTQTLAPTDPQMQLHAWKLAFGHPVTGERMRFETQSPEWAAYQYSSSSSRWHIESHLPLQKR